MSEGEARRVTTERMGEPHVRSRRISVRQIRALVEERGEDPESVADRYDLDVADVYHSLAYYHDNPDEMRRVEEKRDAAIDALRDGVERPAGVDPEE